MRIGAAGIIINDKKLLLIQRSEIHKNFPKYWACPGGGIENGETLEMAVDREVKEEVGLKFVPTALFMKSTWQNLQFNRFLGNWSGTIKTQTSEIIDFGCFSYKDAKKLNLAFDYKIVINKL